MKKLNNKEIKVMADALFMTEHQAQETADIFVKIFTEEQNGKSGCGIVTSLKNVDDYIREYESHCHIESNWQDYYEYEKANCFDCYGDTDAEAEEIFKSIESFKTHVSSFSYELSNGMIVIVC